MAYVATADKELAKLAGRYTLDSVSTLKQVPTRISLNLDDIFGALKESDAAELEKLAESQAASWAALRRDCELEAVDFATVKKTTKKLEADLTSLLS